MKKIMTLILTLVMVLAMGTSAFAATVDITINDAGGLSNYAAYRLLNATESEDGEKFAYTLNSKYTAILLEVTGVTGTTDAEKEKKLIGYLSDLGDDQIREFADNVYAKIAAANADSDNSKHIAPDSTITNSSSTGVNQFKGVPQGYYLIVETSTKEDSEDIISLVMLDTAGKDGVTVTTKEKKPELVKKVDDKDDSTNLEDATKWQDSADYDIGDYIPYKLTGTLSNQYANYKTYYYSFTDTMHQLTFVDNDSEHPFKVVVVNNVDGQDVETEITAGYEKNWNPDTKTLNVTFDDLKSGAVTFASTTTIDKNSKIVVCYYATLDEDAKIGYEGNPNEAYLTYNNNPYFEGDGEDAPTNDTPVDTNIVFTFTTIVNKVDKDGNKLEGAGFTLYKWDSSVTDDDKYVQVGDEIKGRDLTSFEFKGLDAGQYKLEETKVPDGYNKAADIEFVIVAEHSEDPNELKLTKLEVQDLEGRTISGTSDQFKFAVQATGTGNISTDVTNTTGTELPSTGGIGTTIFYVIGGLLVFAAAILLVVKKRMGNRA